MVGPSVRGSRSGAQLEPLTTGACCWTGAGAWEGGDRLVDDCPSDGDDPVDGLTAPEAPVEPVGVDECPGTARLM